MSTSDSAPPALEIPEERGRSWRPWVLAGVLVGATGLAAWGAGARPAQLWTKPAPSLTTIEIDRGDVALVVTENGSLESADSATVRCEVEALMGNTLQQAGGMGGRGGTMAG